MSIFDELVIENTQYVGNNRNDLAEGTRLGQTNAPTGKQRRVARGNRAACDAALEPFFGGERRGSSLAFSLQKLPPTLSGPQGDAPLRGRALKVTGKGADLPIIESE